MCVCAYIVSSRTQVKQAKFTLVQTNAIKHIQVTKCLLGVQLVIHLLTLPTTPSLSVSLSFCCYPPPSLSKPLSLPLKKKKKKRLEEKKKQYNQIGKK